MKLRRLALKDAPLMLEWMHDDSVVHDLNCNFLGRNIYDCENFIEENKDDNSIIVAGSVVLKGKYPSNCIIGGNPAKVIKYIENGGCLEA